MKRCAKCGNQNTDEMRFCLQCGSALPDAPIVVNIGNTNPNQPQARTDNYGQSVNTQVGGNSQYAPPNYNAPANRSGRGSNTKIFLAVGGVLALLFLLFAGVAAIVAYNMMNSEQAANVKPSPSPEATKSTEKESPSPEKSATPDASPTSSSKTTPLKEADSPEITVKFDGVDVDYNVREDGRLGMRMTVNFTVSGMKDKDGYLAIHFQTRDGDPLPAKKGDYRDVNGNLAVFRTLRPDYDDTEYNDLELFLPYDEFKLDAGRHNLKMDIDLLDGKGVSLEHLAYNDFWYEKK